MGSIHHCYTECKTSFECLIESLEAPKRHFGDQIPAKGVANEYGRLKVWSGSVGANHPPGKRMSLDYRLEDSEFYRDSVVDILSRLGRTLRKATQLLCDERLPFEEVTDEIEETSGLDSDDSLLMVSPAGASPRELSHHASESTTSIYAFEHQESTASPTQEKFASATRKEMPQLYEYIQTLIQNLYSLAMVIRRPISTDRLSRAARLPIGHFQEFDEKHVDECFPSASPTLRVRMARAITRRRQLLRYNDLHNRKLSEPQPQATITQITPSRIEPETPSQQQDVDHQISVMPVPEDETGHSAPSLIDRSVLLSSAASKFIPPEAEAKLEVDAQPEDETDTASNYSTGGDERIAIPQRPLDRDRNELDEFLCPFCFHLVRIRTGNAWAKHVFRDLQAYVCTFDDCKEPDQMFETRNEWFDHELQYHRREWACNTPGHATYFNESDFIRHVRKSHFPEASDDQLHSLGELCQRPISTGEVVCPLCTDDRTCSDADLESLPESVRKADEVPQVGNHPDKLTEKREVTFNETLNPKLLAGIEPWFSTLSDPDDTTPLDHPDETLLETWIPAMPTDRKACPYTIEPKKVKRHIASHLQRLALFALIPSQVAEDDHGSGATCDAVPGSTSRHSSLGCSMGKYSEAPLSEHPSLASQDLLRDTENDDPSAQPTVSSISDRLLNAMVTTEYINVREVEEHLHEGLDGSSDEEYDEGYESISQPWIPLSSIQDLAGEIRQVVKTLAADSIRSDQLQTFVSKAPRLSALLVYIDRLHWIEAFCDQNFGDELFPVKISQGDFNTCVVRQLRTKATSSEASVDIQIAKPDDRTIIQTIEDPLQWSFFSPVFVDNGSPYTFDARCRLPFLKEITHRTTNSSAVTERVLHKSHLDLPKFAKDDQIGTVVDDDGNPHVAVKELTSEKWFGPRFKEVGKNEEAILIHFQEKRHDHFIKAIARYTQSRKHYFVFPWAKGGNLHYFWEKQPSLGDDCLNFSREAWNTFIKWFFRQILGISGAIKSLHFPNNNPGGSCRHGDLKPENILCFCDVLPGPGQVPTNVKLVIADAGHAKIHEKATEFLPDPRRTPRGTERYSPPEANNPGDMKPTSRRYDIWSLGCMYLEFLIWILYGHKGLLEFYNDVGNEFFFIAGANVQVKSEVQDWIDAIKVDPRCAPIASTAVGKLVHLIETRLLVVNIEIESTDNTDLQEVKNLGTIRTGPRVTTRPPSIRINPNPILARADANEMIEEMKTIDAAADKGSIKWINWDGMEQASKFGTPQASGTILSGKQVDRENERG